MSRNRHTGTYLGGIPAIATGTVGIETKTITFDPSAQRILVQNTHAVQKLYCSFDGGTNFWTILSGTTLDLFDVGIDNVVVSGENTSTSYEILTVD